MYSIHRLLQQYNVELSSCYCNGWGWRTAISLSISSFSLVRNNLKPLLNYIKTVSLIVEKRYHCAESTLFQVKAGKCRSLTQSHTCGYLSLILFFNQNDWYEILNFAFDSVSLCNVISSSSIIPRSEVISPNGSIIQSGTFNWNTFWNRTSMSAWNSWRFLLYASISALLIYNTVTVSTKLLQAWELQKISSG